MTLQERPQEELKAGTKADGENPTVLSRRQLQPAWPGRKELDEKSLPNGFH
jgi:hypothetical protein